MHHLLASLLLASAMIAPCQSEATALLQLRGGGGLAFDAALFDFDGTLAQSEDLHRLAFSEVLGVTIDEEDWENNCVGTSPQKLMADRLPENTVRVSQQV